MSDQKRYDFWESWCRIFGPPAVDFPGHTEVAPAGIPSVGDVIDVGGQSARVIEVFRTAGTTEADGGAFPFGWRLRAMTDAGKVLICKPLP